MINSNKITADKNAGFTGIEIMIASVILGLVIIISYGFWKYFTDSFDFSFGKSISMSDVYRTTSQIVRELRETQPGEDGSYSLETVNDQELAFFADVDEDGETERVRYWLNGTDLMKGLIEPSGSPAIYDPGTETARIVVSGVTDVSSPLFYYYNSDWPADTVNNPLQTDRQLETRLITVQLSILAEEDRTASASSITTSVNLRRLKDN